MKTKNFIKLTMIAMLFVAALSSCKKEYEAPPVSGNPNLVANTTIKDLKARHTVAGAYDIINDDVIISGVVIANDKTGNLYKEINIRDNTGALNISLANTGLYATYPVGRRVYIKCKGLCLSDYQNYISLGVKSTTNGLVSLEGIAAPLIANYVVGGSLNNDASPKVVTEADLKMTGSAAVIMQNPIVGDLVTLNNYEFQAGDTKRALGDTSNYHSTTKGFTYIKTCGSSTKVLIITSGYADFAAMHAPEGNGSLTAIVTVYGSTPQLVLRGMEDMKMTNPRCFLFEDDFGGYTTTGTTCASMPNWQNIKESGSTCYTIASFSGNIFAKVSAFTDATLATTPVKSWLIMPQITIPSTGTPKFSYTCAMRYTVGTLKALISTDYDGTSQTPSTATWTEFNTIQANNASFTAFLPYPTVGGYDLTPYLGKKVYIAFRYDVPAGTSASAAATYEPDDIKISSN